MADTLRFTGAGVLTFIGIIVFAILLLILIPLLILGLAGAAFSRLGFSWIAAVAVIILMIVGYFVNIPVWTFRDPGYPAGCAEAVVFDAFSGEPVDTGQHSTIITINLGGFIIPVAISGYLLYETYHISGETIFLPLAISLAAVALIVAILTRIQPPLKISVPLIIPSLVAVACGFLLNGGAGLEAAVSAFIGGTMGIILGATAILLIKRRQTGVRLISVGGAGMFGSLFLCALLSTLIA